MFNSVYQLLDQIGYPHPIHPTEVHMPIGLIVGALIFRATATLFQWPTLAQTAHYCTILAFIFLFPTVLFGIMDWQHFYAGAWLYPIKIKFILAVVLIIAVFTSIFLVRTRRAGSVLILTNYSISFVFVVALGYYGGSLVYGGERPKAPENYLVGMEIFNNNCVGCHPKGGNIVDPSLPLLNSTYTNSPAAFLKYIRNPKRPDGSPGVMPSFSSTKITDRQASDLYTYIVQVLESR